MNRSSTNSGTRTSVTNCPGGNPTHSSNCPEVHSEHSNRAVMLIDLLQEEIAKHNAKVRRSEAGMDGKSFESSSPEHPVWLHHGNICRFCF